MTLVVSDYPRKHVGKVAEINGMTIADGPWIAVREAFGITGLRSGVLVRWEEEGLISVAQDSERSPRRYLKPELEIVAKLGTGGPPSLRALRRYLMSRPAGESDDGLPDSPANTDAQPTDASDRAVRRVRGSWPRWRTCCAGRSSHPRWSVSGGYASPRTRPRVESPSSADAARATPTGGGSAGAAASGCARPTTRPRPWSR